jgi:methylphosphotriester-DNA--protein-cysteine methyltransferase
MLKTYQTPHSRWLALSQRDPSSHSSFLYGVKSTKIYCRPTCPARLARRANVVFYDTETQARSDGFRACKRCKPDDRGFGGVGEDIVARVIGVLRERNCDSDGDGGDRMKKSLKALAAEVGVTPSYLCRVFKRTMGVTIGAYMVEFEKEEDNTEDSVRSSDNGMGFVTPEDIARSPPSVTVNTLNGGLVEPPGVENIGEVLDLNFDFDEWFWAEDFLNDKVLECAA